MKPLDESIHRQYGVDWDTAPGSPGSRSDNHRRRFAGSPHLGQGVVWAFVCAREKRLQHTTLPMGAGCVRETAF